MSTLCALCSLCSSNMHVCFLEMCESSGYFFFKNPFAGVGEIHSDVANSSAFYSLHIYL